jgi:hypothetical protein
MTPRFLEKLWTLVTWIYDILDSPTLSKYFAQWPYYLPISYKYSLMEYTRIFDCNVIYRLPRSTLRGTVSKKGKPSNRRIKEVFHHQPSKSLVQKATNTLSFLHSFKGPIQNLTKRNLWGEEILEGSVQILPKWHLVPSSCQGVQDLSEVLRHFQTGKKFRTEFLIVSRQEYGLYSKGKAVPLQAWSGPEGSRKLRFPDYMTTAQDGGKAVSFTHRQPLPPKNVPGTHFC